MSYLGIDIGQSGCKGQAYDLTGKLIVSTAKNYSYEIVSGCIELNPVKIWNSLQALIYDIASMTKKDPVKIICLSFLGSAIMALDEKNSPLSNLIVKGNNDICNYFDGRIKRIKNSQNLYSINGMPLKAVYPLSKALWMLFKSPNKDKVKKFMLIEDYILLKLGIKPALNYSLASLTGLFDINTKEWSKEASSIFGIDLSFFSNTTATGSFAGVLPESMCSIMGLKKGVKVLMGGFDQYMSALASGVVRGNISSNSMGSADCITNVFEKPGSIENFKKSNFQIGPYPAGGLYATLCYINSGGSLLEFFKNTFYSGKDGQTKDFYFNLETGIKKIKNKIFVLPHFLGSGTPWLDDYSAGMIYGLRFESTREDIFISILESNCFELKMNLEIIEKTLGNISELRVSGGGAKSDLWLKIRSNIFGIPVKRVKNQEGGCLAGALFAMVEDKKYGNISEAANDLVRIDKIFYPSNKETGHYYPEKYSIYKKLYKKNKQILNEIARKDFTV
ncbi:MAG: hypothetical protein JW997_05160 [Actinobacteria bacterium]|nr:hypothetical protein [Actinomycetota bacterium]